MPQKTWIQIAIQKKKDNFKQKVVKNSRHVGFSLVQSHFWKDCLIDCDHQVWDPPSYAERFEVKEHKDAPAKQLFALVFMCGDPSPLPWMTTMAWWSPMARPCKTLSVLNCIERRSNLPSKMKIIVIMALIAIIYHNHNVVMLVLAMMISDRIQMMLEMIFLCNNYYFLKKKQQSNLPSVRSAMSALPLKGAQSLEHRVTIYLTVKNKTITGKIFPEEQTNQGNKGLQYPIIFLRILFVGPQHQLQWFGKTDVRFNNFQRGTGRAFQSPVVTAFVVPASFDP